MHYIEKTYTERALTDRDFAKLLSSAEAIMKNSNSGLYIIYGQAGSGKSSLARYIIKHFLNADTIALHETCAGVHKEYGMNFEMVTPCQADVIVFEINQTNNMLSVPEMLLFSENMHVFVMLDTHANESLSQIFFNKFNLDHDKLNQHLNLLILSRKYGKGSFIHTMMEPKIIQERTSNDMPMYSISEDGAITLHKSIRTIADLVSFRNGIKEHLLTLADSPRPLIMDRDVAGITSATIGFLLKEVVLEKRIERIVIHNSDLYSIFAELALLEDLKVLYVQDHA